MKYSNKKKFKKIKILKIFLGILQFWGVVTLLELKYDYPLESVFQNESHHTCLSHIKQEYKESLIEGKLPTNKIRTKALKIGKPKV